VSGRLVYGKSQLRLRHSTEEAGRRRGLHSLTNSHASCVHRPGPQLRDACLSPLASNGSGRGAGTKSAPWLRKREADGSASDGRGGKRFPYGELSIHRRNRDRFLLKGEEFPSHSTNVVFVVRSVGILDREDVQRSASLLSPFLLTTAV